MGRVVVSRGVNEAMENKQFSLEVGLSLKRYAVKDWGDLCESDKQINNDALQNPDDLYLLAAYQTCREKFISSQVGSRKIQETILLLYVFRRKDRKNQRWTFWKMAVQ